VGLASGRHRADRHGIQRHRPTRDGRSRGEERLQLKWLVFAAAGGIAFTVLLLVVSEGAAAKSAFLLLAASLVVVLIPLSVGIAVLKTGSTTSTS
jgi:hypothetical protein